MSYIVTVPAALAGAANDLANSGSALAEANRAAAAQTTGVLFAAQDEVSAAAMVATSH
jgi:hypothetical protein